MDFVYMDEIHTHLPRIGSGCDRDRNWVRYPPKNQISKDANTTWLERVVHRALLRVAGEE